jgi:hypothetical protein
MKMGSPLPAAACLVPLFAAALGACKGGGTDVPSLTPEQVAGVYSICSLRFIPEQGALPAANLLQTVINTAPPAPKQPPSLTLSGTEQRYQLVYTRKSDNFLQTVSGDVHLYPTQAALDLPNDNQSEVTRELLLPTQLWLGFAENPRHLLTNSTLVYQVRRADYARAAGITENGLADQISGSLSATFSTGACP